MRSRNNSRYLKDGPNYLVTKVNWTLAAEFLQTPEQEGGRDLPPAEGREMEVCLPGEQHGV